MCVNLVDTSYGSSTYGGGSAWLWVDITELYQDWRQGVAPNYGLILSSGLFDWYVFASADHPDESLRPRVVITTKGEIPTLRFPLDGVYSDDRITGYDFGDWWKDKRCDEGNHKSPRLRHTGIDLRAEVGDEVYAVAEGEVKYARTDPVNGGYIVVEHDAKWTSTYTHVLPDVTGGQKVVQGDQIGRIALIGEPHLHFQVRLGVYEEPWSRRGRLPDKTCFVSETGITEPAFPEQFLDPKCLDWE